MLLLLCITTEILLSIYNEWIEWISIVVILPINIVLTAIDYHAWQLKYYLYKLHMYVRTYVTCVHTYLQKKPYHLLVGPTY